MRVTSSVTLFLIVASTVVAGDGAPAVPDRTRGEEEQILARERWFGERRGLAAIPRADLLRRAAVDEARQLRARSSERVEGLAWQPLGPDAMTMLGWVMGPVAGRVSALAVHPDNEQVLYLGAASGGLWKSTDGGGSWISLFDDVGTQTIGSIALDPSDPNTIWVGTGEQGQSCWDYFGLGLFRSTDGGLTWEERNGSGSATLRVSFVSSMAVHPTVPGLVLAGGHGYCSGGGYYYGGLFRSTDSGSSWAQVLGGAVTDIVPDPVDPNLVIAGRGRWGQPGDGVYRSTDAGSSWQRLTNGLPVDGAVGRIRLARAPSDRGVLYALVDDRAGSAALYRSTDGGDTWVTRNTSACEGQCWYDLCLDVHPTDPGTLLVGSIRFSRSTDGGATLTPLIAGWGSSQKVHQDIHVLAYSSTDPNRFWVGGDGGLWRTDDGGVSFANLNGNLNITQLYDLAVHPLDPGTVFGGSQDNSSQRRSGDQHWDVTVVTGDGFMNVVDPADPDVVFQTSYPSGGEPNLCMSTDGGSPNSFRWLWNQGLTADEPYPWVTPLVAAELASATDTPLFLASNHVYRSATTQPWYAFQWTKISPDLTGSTSVPVSVITPVATAGTVGLYVGTENGKVWWCGDALAPSPTWVEVTGGLPEDWVSDIAVDPANPERVYLTRGNFGASRVYRSTSAGTSWAAVGSGVPDAPANAVAVDPRDGNRVFVGSDVGVFESLDGGDTFAALMTGLPLGAVVTDLEVSGEPPRLTAGTYGRGAWQLELDRPALFADDFESGGTDAWSGVVP